MCLLEYVLNCDQNFTYFDPDYPTSGLTLTGLTRVYLYRARQKFAVNERLAYTENCKDWKAVLQRTRF
jgi:hypothetical protein